LLIKRLQQKTGMSVLFISHDIQLVAEMADRVAVFYRGQMVESGPVLELMKAPKNPYTRALLSCRPGLYQPGERLPVVADFMDEGKNQQQGGPELHLHSVQGSSKADAQAISAVEMEKQPQDFVPRESAGGLIENQRNYKDQSPLLILKNLNVWYPTAYHFWGQPKAYNKAVQAVTLEVFQGETLGLVGGSGCGKTTLGRAVMGLTPIHSGEIWYKGKLLTRAGHKETTALAREIQMIFQDPYGALNPKISIGQAIAETLSVHRLYPRSQIKTEVLRWLDRVGLKPEWYDRYPHEFSGGQRQRIVIARALALRPSFVICDESVSALDVSVQAQILNLLNELKAALNFTSIFISHDLSVVHYLSDRIAVMNKGKLEEIGIAGQVYRQPASPYTQSLIAAIPKMPETPSVSASNI
ncbi:MAG TPA: ATP-binding cassette domain-containing protein, partial [Arachidicoccus sp.]|nr:ATP-binding cassette domain-containing protein [Arachidicoccus sp.]